jgi:VWFA-related protein
MAASDLTFDRQVASVDTWLDRRWTWGQRGRVGVDAREQLYQTCYPGMPQEPVKPEEDDRGVADEMIARRREHLTIAALGELTDYLRVVRDERKGVIVVSAGWPLFKPDRFLQRALFHRLPSGPTPGVDPRTGQLSARPTEDNGGDFSRCEADRFALAEMDDASEFNDILGRANRSNVTFYPIDPRGLAAFDSEVSDQRTGRPPAGKSILPSAQEDAAMLGMRQAALRTLAVDTDGMAVLNTQDLAGGLRRIVDDLSVYYLLGYSSTGKPDGRFHSVQVRVARRGITIRARRGFRAITQAEIAAIAPRSASAAPVDPSATAFANALGTLGTIARTTSVRLIAAAGWNADGSPAIWVSGELGAGEEWRSGARVDGNVTIDGGDAATSRTTIDAGTRTFELTLKPARPTAGEATVSVRVSPVGGGSATVESVRLRLPDRGATAGALVKRKGPSTANRVVPAADLRFRRSEQIVVEQPAVAPNALPTARLLDRNDRPLPLTLTIADHTDTTRLRWVTASLTLAPLAPGDYVIELTQTAADPARTLVAFRVIP